MSPLIYSVNCVYGQFTPILSTAYYINSIYMKFTTHLLGKCSWQRLQRASLDITRSGAFNPGPKESFYRKRELPGRTPYLELKAQHVLHILDASCSRNPRFKIFQTFSSLFPKSDSSDLGLDAPDLVMSREALCSLCHELYVLFSKELSGKFHLNRALAS